MIKLKKLFRRESGQAMIAVLVCMALGGLIIAPLVSYTGTSVHSVTLKKNSTMGSTPPTRA